MRVEQAWELLAANIGRWRWLDARSAPHSVTGLADTSPAVVGGRGGHGGGHVVMDAALRYQQQAAGTSSRDDSNCSGDSALQVLRCIGWPRAVAELWVAVPNTMNDVRHVVAAALLVTPWA